MEALDFCDVLLAVLGKVEAVPPLGGVAEVPLSELPRAEPEAESEEEDALGASVTATVLG